METKEETSQPWAARNQPRRRAHSTPSLPTRFDRSQSMTIGAVDLQVCRSAH